MMKVQNNQRLVDLCMQQYGSADYLFDVAAALGLSVTDNLDGITTLDMPVLETTGQEKAVALVLQKKWQHPASGNDDDFNPPVYPPRGIGHWKITNPLSPAANDFIVS